MFYLRKIKYPRLFFLLLSYLCAGFVLLAYDWQGLGSLFTVLGYSGAILIGFLYAFSFTAMPATMLLLLWPTTDQLYLVALLAGFGALLGDLVLLKFFRNNFLQQEINQFFSWPGWSKFFVFCPVAWRAKVLTMIGFLVIASPLPDELGVFILSRQRQLSDRLFCLLSFGLNLIGVLLVLGLGW